MKTKGRKTILSLLLIGVMVLGSSLCVYADTSSDWQTQTVYGYSYDYCSSIWNRYFTTGNTIEAVAEVITTNRKNAPAGYMGAQARLYNSSGTLVYSSSMVYNSSPVINVYAYSERTTSSGYFYAQSKVSFYNGNGYTSYTANKSPNAAVPSALNSNVGYSVNANNETYGLGILAETLGIEPDLIAAVGRDGTEGYVRSEDLSPTPSNPKEAVVMAELAQTDRCIPLYNLDGEVIGEFMLNAVEDDEVSSIEALHDNY